MSSQEIYPVVIIHAKKDCPACTNLLKDQNLNEIKKIINRVNPDAQLRIFHHDRWGATRSNPESPPIGKLMHAPLVLITPSNNANPNGDINKVQVYGMTYDNSKGGFVATQNSLTMSLWLEKYLLEIKSSSTTSRSQPASTSTSHTSNSSNTANTSRTSHSSNASNSGNTANTSSGFHHRHDRRKKNDSDESRSGCRKKYRIVHTK